MKDYESEVQWNGTEYVVGANLWDDGVYKDIPADDSGPEELEIIEDPVFYDFEVYDTDTEEYLDNPHSEIISRAKEVFSNIYWDRVCWG